ncbi:MAG TPA: class A beta-lactamase-related serine hydrolase [Phycisphaerales bacterium]|nr:class A beta-lactamase-related serine hydrolase [Phycisphaerales bacterium]
MRTCGSLWVCRWVLVVSLAGVWGCDQQAPVQPDVSLSAEGLGRITQLMEEEVEQSKLAGAVAMVAVGGQVVYEQAVGHRDREAAVDMSADTIFRIASMTKPVTSVAVMILYDEGKIALDDPLSKYIPEFANPKVLTATGGTVAAEREITIRDLLTHTSGLGYHWDAGVGPMYNEAGIGHGVGPAEGLLGEKMAKMGAIPLLFMPGSQFHYSLSVDVLGRVVEVASGQTLAEFMEGRIFKPLGMTDTFFFVPQDKLDRLAVAYAPAEGGGLKRLGNEALTEGLLVYGAAHPYEGERRYYSGGGGLCSTAGDYLRFAQMLANGGTLDGKRILKGETVAMMTTDQVGERWQGGEGFGLGFGVARDTPAAAEMGCVGSYGWGGFWYTTFFVDPARNIVGVCMGQLHPAGPSKLNGEFKRLVYQAVE